MNFTIHGRDTLISEYVENGLKLVIYTDSVECSSCVISKMYLWNSIIEKAAYRKGTISFKCDRF